MLNVLGVDFMKCFKTATYILFSTIIQHLEEFKNF